MSIHWIFEPMSDLFHGPFGMLRNERVRGMSGFLEGGKVRCCSGVAEGNADVSEEAVVLDALDGRLGEEGAEVFHGEGEKVAESVVENRFASVKLSFLG